MIPPKRGRPRGTSTSDHQSYGALGDLIRKHRLRSGLGLAQIAESCACSVQFISNIEHGRAPLPWSKVPALARILGISESILQSANFSVRSDFKSIANLAGKRIRRPAVLRTMAENYTLISTDPSLQEIVSRYQSAPEPLRRNLFKVAQEILVG